MDRSGQAVVLGGGMAGMLAARVLADTFEQVTIIERHTQDVADSMESRTQDDRPGAAPALAQVLSERARPLERLFPDLSTELMADGARAGWATAPFTSIPSRCRDGPAQATRAPGLGQPRGCRDHRGRLRQRVSPYRPAPRAAPAP